MLRKIITPFMRHPTWHSLTKIFPKQSLYHIYTFQWHSGDGGIEIVDPINERKLSIFFALSDVADVDLLIQALIAMRNQMWALQGNTSTGSGQSETNSHPTKDTTGTTATLPS